MKVIVIDDGDVKIGPLLKLLEGRGIDSDDIDVVNNIARAKGLVRTKQYAIAVVDLLIGQVAGATAKADAGLDFIKWVLDDRSKAIRPWRMIGFTSHESAAIDSSEEFNQLGIPLLYSGVASSPDLSKIESSVDELLELERTGALPATSHKVDFAIVCALDDPEFSSLEGLMPDGNYERLFPGVARLKRVEITTNSGERRTLILAAAGAMGSVPSCYLVTKLIEKYYPRTVIMVGICGGLPGRSNLGDIICATNIENFQSGKIYGGSLLKDRLGIDTAESQFPFFRDLKGVKKIVASCNLEWGGVRPDFGGEQGPDYLVGELGCSDLVVADKSFVEELKSDYRQMLGVEMEGYGAGFACKFATGINFLLLKSVCDLAGEEKNDEIQAYCSHLSASLTKQLIIQELV